MRMGKVTYQELLTFFVFADLCFAFNLLLY